MIIILWILPLSSILFLIYLLKNFYQMQLTGLGIPAILVAVFRGAIGKS